MMSNLHIQTEQPPPSQVPLLTSISNQQQQQNHETVSNSNNNNNNNNNNSNNNDDESKTELDQTLARVETYLTLLGFNQSSIFTFILSWTLFATVGVALPLIALRFINCSSFNCERFDIKSFEIDIVAFQASLAAVSLLCLSHNLRKYGLRRFLFVDRHGGNMACFHNDYVKQISGSMRLLILWLLPCILLKTVREIIRASYAQQGSWQLSLVLTLALIISWTYVSAISLSASILFHLVCNLQVIHFDDYGKLLQRESDVLVFMEEHIRLRYHLSKISHRFRIYLLLGFLVVTASQCVTLLQVTGYAGSITFINGGDFAASTIVQVVGIIICLHAATRISHRAQSVVSLANMWHALLTCTSSDPSQMRNSIHLDYSENDLESMDFARSGMPTNTQLASYLSSHHRRQAFVMYLQTNPGGITIFGWTVDRSFVNTIFFLELSLVTFVLSKTII
ncbi:PREDICTED: putative phosphatidylinositol N-acetylglucosaminyltransferase subunit C isoform X2 [Lupinus angustifolius]|uniref:putative phosphatidylinositol N-acetylglucosaminyltransferase subunit C isoform X2 n=1 Tax=Lupinus angustifolius TaxID=3871 RepID=UPI00092FBDE8|nr:PREDICTED: putative phosphatidylinositol N-acetylglucosaminyltransferase subunit C isoform X2 [Lupinus angustifolius]